MYRGWSTIVMFYCLTIIIYCRMQCIQNLRLDGRPSRKDEREEKNVSLDILNRHHSINCLPDNSKMCLSFNYHHRFSIFRYSGHIRCICGIGLLKNIATKQFIRAFDWSTMGQLSTLIIIYSLLLNSCLTCLLFKHNCSSNWTPNNFNPK